jgi:Flp pilus assembly protein TadG
VGSSPTPGTYRIHTPFCRLILGFRQHEPKLQALLPADRGSAVVEFALVLPLLLLVVLAVVQVGLLGRDQLLVTQSSRAGAPGR